LASVRGVDDEVDRVLLGVDDDGNLEGWPDLAGVPECDFWSGDLCSEVEGLLVEGFFLFSLTQRQ